jgi:hypothetical protein
VAKSNTSEEKVNQKTRRKARVEGEALGMFYSHFRNFGRSIERQDLCDMRRRARRKKKGEGEEDHLRSVA